MRTRSTAAPGPAAIAGDGSAPGGDDNSVECSGIVKTYPDGTVALRGIDLSCPAGGITVLLGASGCGKTTLLRSIAGLTPVSGGTIRIGGVDVTRAAPESRGVAMVFQGSALYPDKSAFANIEFPLRMSGVPKAERLQRVTEVAQLLDVTHLLDRKPGELSGGQRQRIGIGRAIVRRPRVVLMDEPLSALDAELRARMRTEIHALQREIAMTVVYVTHDQIEALSLADQLVVLRDGQIEQVGDPESVFRKPRTLYVAQFLGAMNVLPGEAIQQEVFGTRGFSPAYSTTLSVGFRAEDVRPGTSGTHGDVNLGGPVRVAELLGRERLLHFVVAGDQVMRARISADAEVSAEVSVHVRRENLHFFGADGIRVDPLS